MNSEGYASEKERNKYCLLFCAASAAVLFAFYRSAAAMLIAVPAAVFLCGLYSETLCQKRRELKRLQFKDLLFSLASSFAAGRQMNEALKEGRDNLSLIYGSDSPLAEELSAIIKKTEETRMSEESVLSDFAKSSDISEIRDFFDIYICSQSTGADVISVVSRASDALMEKMEIEQAVRTMCAQKRFEARIISMMPLIMLIGFNILSPDYIAPLYAGAGRLIMTLCLLLIVFGYYRMMKLTKIDI